MRLVVFDDSRLGLLRDGTAVVDVSDLVGAGGAEWPPVFLLRAIAGFDGLRPRLLEALQRRSGIPLDRVRLRAPVVFPTKVIAAPVNYRLHLEEMRPLVKGELHAIERYGLFLKAPSSLVGPEATIELPFPDRRTDHEVELGVVIGRTARSVGMGDAMRHVFGYTGVMDITVRGDEDRSTRKSFDTFTPVGPALVTADEIPDPHDLRLELWVNGERRQDGNTRDMIWNVPKLVEYASHVMTLNPGDLLSTGTPDGVGPLKPGDQVTMEVARIGRMSVRVDLRKS
jgi:2-keto-4-pentenoate hydratase/2-oxohepta-3-ene-1,7-dioic acid hydratase in catechol pathway